MHKFQVGQTDTGLRADTFVAGKYPEFTRSSLKELFERHMVSIGDHPAKPGQRLREGEQVSVDTSLLFMEPKKVELPIIYEDDDTVVINKPVGILTHSKGALNLESTVASFIKPKITDKRLQGNRAGIIHRLDRATSGVIIAAKNSKTLAYLQKQFSNRKVKKTYIAVVEGVPRPEEAIIDAPIARNPKKPQTFKVSRDGKAARTRYKILNESSNLSLLELNPETGRTHQLRVHLAYIGHPILGDDIYGHGNNKRLMLHAMSLELNLPSGKKQKFVAPVPEEFKECLK